MNFMGWTSVIVALKFALQAEEQPLISKSIILRM